MDRGPFSPLSFSRFFKNCINQQFPPPTRWGIVRFLSGTVIAKACRYVLDISLLFCPQNRPSRTLPPCLPGLDLANKGGWGGEGVQFPGGGITMLPAVSNAGDKVVFSAQVTNYLEVVSLKILSQVIFRYFFSRHPLPASAIHLVSSLQETTENQNHY